MFIPEWLLVGVVLWFVLPAVLPMIIALGWLALAYAGMTIEWMCGGRFTPPTEPDTTL
jgi:hypothetical protein